MLRYNPNLKLLAPTLRSRMTESEQALWSRLRNRKMLGVQFYRQKPIGDFIVDFYAPRAKLVIEVDGSRHLEEGHLQRDKERDAYLAACGLRVLRFNNLQVLKELDAVADVIYQAVLEQLGRNPP